MKQTQFFSIEINKPLPAPVQSMMSMMTSQILKYVDSLKAQKNQNILGMKHCFFFK